MNSKVKVGQLAPKLKATTLSGKNFDVHALEHTTMLQFHRYVGCPVCHLHIHDYLAEAEKWRKRGLDIVVIYYSSEDDIKSIGKFPASDSRIEFISDEDMSFYRSYGINFSLWGTISPSAWKDGLRALINGHSFKGAFQKKGIGGIPACFLIDTNGIVQKVHYGKNINGTLPVKGMYKWLEEVGQ